MNTEEVALKVVELCRKQAWKEAVQTLYADGIVSVEAQSMSGGSPETHGIEGVQKKVDWWTNTMEVHSFKVSGPFVAHDRLVVQFDGRCYGQGLEEALADVRGGRLHRERGQDRAGRIPAGSGR